MRNPSLLNDGPAAERMRDTWSAFLDGKRYGFWLGVVTTCVLGIAVIVLLFYFQEGR